MGGFHPHSMDYFLAGNTAIFSFHTHYGIHMECPWNGAFHMHSMEFPMNLYDGILWKETIQCVVKNGVAVKNQTANFMICHVCKPENILTAAPCNHYKTID
jgi:hypothetical protein